MKFFAENTEKGLIPLYPSDLEEKKKLKIGERVRCERWKNRDIVNHNRFFALIKVGAENSKSVEMPVDTYRKYATIKSGYFKLYHTPKGVFVDAESISFKNMDEDKFEKVYSDVLDFIIKDTGADRNFIEKNLLGFM